MDRRRPRQVRRLLRSVLAAAALGGLPVLLALGFFASRFAGLTDSSALEQAQLARQIARGEGFSTQVLTPLDLARVPVSGRGRDFRYAPLYPLLLSRVVGTEGARDNPVGLLSLGFWLATVALTCAFAWRLFGGRAAAVATVLLVVNVTLLREAISGRETLAWAFAVGVWLFLTHELASLPGAEGSWWLPASSGAVFGVCCLLSYQSLALLAPALIVPALLAPARRGRTCLIFLGAVLVVAAPWLIRNLVTAGNPLFSLSWWAVATNTESHPGDTVLQWSDPGAGGPLVYAFVHAGEVVRKFALGLARLRDGLFATTDAYVMAMFLLGAMMGRWQENAARLRTGVCILLLAAAPTALGSGHPRVFAPLVPVVTIFAVQFFLERLERLQLGFRISADRRLRSGTMRTAALYLALAIAVYPLVVAFATAPYQYYDPARPAPFENLRERIPEGATVLTNFPWHVAWYTDRRAVLLPRTTAELAGIEQRLGRVDWLLLSPPLHAQLISGDPVWSELYSRTGHAAAGFAAGQHMSIAPGLTVVVRPREAVEER
ncbi:MAG: hypothetical protein ACE5R4_15595 [Armatimonadota bacterium]